MCLKEPFGNERTIKIIEYGFNCSKKEVPVILTNFEEHLKESTTKYNEFSDAQSILKKYGTGLNSQKKISIPYGKNAICIIDNCSVKLTKPLGEFPNSTDKYDNVYFGIGSSEQAIRIGMRKLCEYAGFPNARNSPSVIFYILNLMSLMYLNSIDLECEHMKELRKLAKAQISMEVMVTQGKYDGKGCWAYWKDGKQIPMHFSKTTTHTSLSSDNQINPLGLSEPVWWAVMMSMLGLFDEQKPYYSNSLEQMGILSTNDGFLTWFFNTYSEVVKGKIGLETIESIQQSMFTLDYFEPEEEVFELKEHNECKTKTLYSKTEIETYIMTGGCVWCKYKPLSTDLCQVVRENWSDKIFKSMKRTKPIQVINSTISNDSTISNVFSNLKLNVISNKYRINLIGITGSGKSTCADLIKNWVIQKNGIVLIVSADKWSKQNYAGKDLQNKILDEIRKFDAFIGDFKVVIMDLCNENKISKESFGFNFSTYTDLYFYPNLYKTNLDQHKFYQYESWCLTNVLSRPLCNSTSNYWLNPESAGVETCIKVHNAKAKGIAKIIHMKKTCDFNEKLSIEDIIQQIKSQSDKYTEYLGPINLSDQIEIFMSNIQL